MGGFSIIFLMFLWPLMCGMMAVALLLPFLKMVADVVVAVLLTVNVLILLCLLFARSKWKGTGRMEPAYIDSFTGWRRYSLKAAKYAFLIGPVWEGIVTALCAAYFIFQPLRGLL